MLGLRNGVSLCLKLGDLVLLRLDLGDVVLLELVLGDLLEAARLIELFPILFIEPRYSQNALKFPNLRDEIDAVVHGLLGDLRT